MRCLAPSHHPPGRFSCPRRPKTRPRRVRATPGRNSTPRSAKGTTSARGSKRLPKRKRFSGPPCVLRRNRGRRRGWQKRRPRSTSSTRRDKHLATPGLDDPAVVVVLKFRGQRVCISISSMRVPQKETQDVVRVSVCVLLPRIEVGCTLGKEFSVGARLARRRLP